MSDGFAYLTAEQRESLRGLPFPVLIPLELPDGWSVSSLDAGTEDDETDVNLTLSGAGASVVMMATDGGVGDALPGERTESLEHPELGTIFVEHYEEPDPDEFQTQWLALDDCPASYALRGRGLDEAGLQALLDSLDLFEPTP